MRARTTSALALCLALAACGGEDRGGGSAPPAAKGPTWTAEQLAALMAVDVPGYERHEGKATPTSARWSYTRETPTEGGATLTIRVEAGTCAEPSLCFPLDPENKMNASHLEQSKASLEARGMKDPTVKLTSIDLPGDRQGLYFWHRGYAEKPRASGSGVSRETSQLMSIRWHDGGSGILLTANARTDGEIESREAFERTMPEEDTRTALIEVFGTLANQFPE